MGQEKEIQLNNYIMVDTNPMGRSQEITEFEKDFIVKYFKNVFPEISKNSMEIELINSNFFYESYSLIFQDKKFLFKVSFDISNGKLETEHKALKEVGDMFAPSTILYKTDETNDIAILLTTWENGLSFDSYGTEDLIYNIGTFSAVLDAVHESSSTQMQSFKDRFLQNESILSAVKNEDPKELKIFEKLIDLDISGISDIFTKIREEFIDKYEEDIPVLCHSNLKKSNILYQEGLLKLINFENSHTADIYYSLLKAINNLELYTDSKYVRSFLIKYHEFSKILGDLTLEDFMNRFQEKKEINRMLIFQDLLHKTLFHFFAYGAFYRTANLCDYMAIYLNLRPTLEKFLPEYIVSLDKLFLTPLQSVKTYDEEELNILASMAEEAKESE